jgi:uncharacterized protein with HEPN domain
MSHDPLRISDYLSHMREAIDRIARYTEDVDESGFLGNPMIQDAVLRNIEIIGEAARIIERTAPDFAARHADVPWAVIYTMRNCISHGYFKVDLEIVWKTLRSDLPELAVQVSRLIDSLRSTTPQR